MESIEGILNAKGRTIYSIRPEAMVLRAAETMCSAHISALLVLERDCIAGIFSERDLLQRVVLSRLDPAHVEVGEVMTRRVVCTGGDVSPEEAMEVMTRECVRHLPVLCGRHVDGIVSMGDLVRWTIREREHAVEQLTEYVAGKYPG